MGSIESKIARSFVAARREARALEAFPGDPPTGLAQAYRVQEAAIALWPDKVAGWKIGRVPPHQTQALGEERLTGPIFLKHVWRAQNGAEVAFPVFEGGFAAVEAEYVLRLGKDVPPEDAEWTREDAAKLIAALHTGIETAGSPLATINDLGATVVVSDFGNNHGLILGPEIPDWRDKLAQGLDCETQIEGKSVGAGSVLAGPNDPIAALVFLLRHMAQRGRTLHAGDLISTGAVTGVHDVRAGQHSRVSFNGLGDMLCAAVKAMPHAKGFS